MALCFGDIIKKDDGNFWAGKYFKSYCHTVGYLYFLSIISVVQVESYLYLKLLARIAAFSLGFTRG